LNRSAPQTFAADQGGQTWHAEAPAALSHFVVGYLGREHSGYCERFTIFPNARIELLFNFGSPYLTNSAVGQPLYALASASLFAPKLERNEHQCGPHTEWFLVQLSLSGSRALLGECASDLLQRDRALRNIIGECADHLFRELQSASSFGERCVRFSRWAMARAAANRNCRVSAFCEHARRVPVANVQHAAEWCGVGPRRLRDIFRAEMGTSPKQWLSLVRAERLWTSLHPDSGPTPVQAWEYADESHAHREFKHWTGLTIGEFRTSKAGGDGLVNGGPRLIVPSGSGVQ